MTSDYISVIPENGTYKWIIKIPKEASSRWTKVPSEFNNISKLKTWLSNDYPQDNCVVILFSIWTGLDFHALDFLIKESFLISNLKYFYQDRSSSGFRISFFEDAQFRHSLIVMFFSNCKMESILNGKIDYDMLKKKLVKYSQKLPS